MRRLSPSGPFVLRTALKILLAVVLCLNGFLVPVAMAAPVPADAQMQAEAAVPCHGDAADTALAKQARQGAPDSPAHPDCCKRGHCLCAVLFSLQVPEVGLPALAPQAGAVGGRDGVDYASLRSAVALRPPIA